MAKTSLDSTPTSNNRKFKSSEKKMHDLYRLDLAIAKKDKSYTVGVLDLVDIPHIHFYHSIDSKGVAQNTSVATNGHFHVLEVVTPATDKDPAVLKCSPPMQWVRKRNSRGQWEKKLALANSFDSHVHDVSYIDSHPWVPQKINPEYIKLQQKLAAPPSVEGVSE